MAVKDRLKEALKVNRKTFFDPLAWVGYNSVKSQSVFLFDFFKTLFAVQKPQREETYEQALARQNISEAEVQETGKTYYFYSLIFFGFAIASFLSSFYFLFYDKTFSGWLLALAVSALLGAQAFRYNFWAFQIKHRKLGCTFEEWKRGKPDDNKTEGPTG